MIRLKVKIFAVLGVLCFVKTCEAAMAAISIDLGAQYMKIALVKPGVPMDIVTNRESKRKTDTQIYIGGDDRFIGDSAIQMRSKQPKQVYAYLVDLLGKKFQHPAVHLFQKRFPYYKLESDSMRGTVVFQDDANSKSYSVEELLGMIIADARKMAIKIAGHDVKDAIITVPAYFNQAERRAVVQAAELGGVNLLQLMNDNTAAGINYGMYRRGQFNESGSKIMIYDMGASHTTATVYEYSLLKDKFTKESNPHMTVLGVGYDRTLGGLEITMRLRDHLAKIFEETHKKKLKGNLRENQRAMNKLLKEAERLKTVLSANNEHYAQVEHLFEDIDMKISVTRKDLEDLIEDLFPRIEIPIQKALEMAEIRAENLDYIILMGGGSRLPKIQEILQKVVGNKELSKFLNTDEAVAMGAVYQAAHRIKGFKVKKFLFKDCNLYPIVVDFEKVVAPAEDEEKPQEDKMPEKKKIRRTLFNAKNQYPQKRKMTFSKHAHDFEFFVNYGDLTHLSTEQMEFFGDLNITRIYVSGIVDAIKEQTAQEGTVYKGAVAHFKLDDSGILQLESANVSFSRNVTLVEEAESASSTLKKLGEKFTSFFTGSSSGDEKKENATETESTAESEKENRTTSSDEEKSETKEMEKNETSTDQKPAINTTEEKAPVKLKIEQKELPLNVEKSFVDILHVSEEQLKEMLDRIKHFETIEKKKLALAKARNDLESYVIDIKYKMIDDELYMKSADDKEREEITKLANELSDWLDEQGPDTERKEYETRLKSIKDLSKELNSKVEQAKERPKAVETMSKVLNSSNLFLNGVKNLTVGENALFTATEILTLGKLIDETQKWFDEKQTDQSKLANSAKPTFTVRDIMDKVGALEREVQYLITKIKFAKPKAKKEEKTVNETTSGNETKATEEQTSEKTTDEEPKQEKEEKSTDDIGETEKESEKREEL